MKSVLSSMALVASLSLSGVYGANSTSNPEGLTCPTDNPTGNSTGNNDAGYLSVVGVQGTEIYPRLEVRDLEKDPIMWNLFLQAFAKFQAMDQQSKQSYFQIGGKVIYQSIYVLLLTNLAIHGAPFVTWDGVEPIAGNDQMGYCPHVSNIFGTWHRPYLALFEQMLHDHAKEIADQFPAGEMRQQYHESARKLRLPYWDWAMDPPNPDEGAFPESFRRPTATITTANGTQMEIPNPLFQYEFHPLNPSDFASLVSFFFDTAYFVHLKSL